MLDAVVYHQAIVEVLRKSVELTPPQVAKLLEIMSVPTEHHDQIVAKGILRGLFVTNGHSIRLARQHEIGAGMANDLRSAA